MASSHLIGGLIGVLMLAACGGGGGPEDDRSAGSEREIPGGADPAEARVIDEWAMALRAGDVAGAASFFAIPSVAENGPTLILIRDAGDARAFNASLPCGARLIRATAADAFVVATFRLTERPGPGSCGSGTGDIARTAFVISNGKIVEWRRVLNGGDPAPSRSI